MAREQPGTSRKAQTRARAMKARGLVLLKAGQSAASVAAECEVAVKTVHNWASEARASLEEALDAGTGALVSTVARARAKLEAKAEAAADVWVEGLDDDDAMVRHRSAESIARRVGLVEVTETRLGGTDGAPIAMVVRFPVNDLGR